MPREVRISNRAARDLGRVRDWYTQPGAGRRARKRLKAINEAVEDLANTPVAWPYGDELGTRERVIEGHVIVYEVENDTGDAATAGAVNVLAIFGPGQIR